jgi:general secretion pathway protein J
MRSSSSGFTLVEVLVAMAITAFVAVAGYTSLTAVISGVDSLREESRRLNDINRTFQILGKDLHQLVNRSVYDEFGSRRSAFEGGELAPQMLSFTRAGWHNTVGLPRSTLQRVAYYLDEDQFVRATWPVLDTTGAIEPNELVLLSGVESIDVRFLTGLDQLEVDRNSQIDRRYWQENWVPDLSRPDALAEPPLAVEIRLQILDWGELERLYVLPPL